MSCGYNPEMIAKLMGQAKTKASEEASVQEKKLEELKDRLTLLEAAKSVGGQGRGDWTDVYEKSSKVGDIAAITEEINVLEKKIKKSKVSGHEGHEHGGCNHDHSAEKSIYDLPFSEKIAKCKSFLTYGKLYFGECQFQRSLNWFEKASTWLAYTFPNQDDAEEVASFFKTEAYILFWTGKSNLALGNLKDASAKFNSCVKSLDELKCDELHHLLLEALLLNSQSQRRMHHFSISQQNLRHFSQVFAGEERLGKLYQREKKILLAQIKRYKQNSKEMAARIFAPNVGIKLSVV